jgi:CubicO group peptidase (beta-lactamase class C family)
MQQVELGRVDLDEDVNRYLDFRVAPYHGKPVTVRNLMIHTPGFEDYIKSLFVAAPSRLQTLGAYLKTGTPKRVYEPGEVVAYSNYGATMAGYIVERVSGEMFDDYIDRHIFGPLKMAHSTFRQPLPQRFEAEMATGYDRASGPAKPYELVNGRPAGSSSMTADDMAHFMIAHLNNGTYEGAQILKPENAIRMRTEQPRLMPHLPGMALGFYHSDRNGHLIAGHGGDTQYFHSDLQLLPEDHVGLFVSMNSMGKDGAAESIRAALLRGFMDRYFPDGSPPLPTAPTAMGHARAMEGLYWWSRRMHSSYFAIMNLLGQSKVTANPDGTITVSSLRDWSGAPRVWREVAPYHWVDRTGGSHMSARVEGGKVVYFASDDAPPVMALMPVPAWASASWNLPLLWFTLAVLLLTAALWPVQALVRRRYGQNFPHSGRRALAYRLVRGVAMVDLLGLAAYAYLVSRASAGIGHLDGEIDLPLRIAQLLCLAGALGSLAGLWNLVTTWTDRASGWWPRVCSISLAVACAAFTWFVISLHLVRASTQF